MNNRAFTAIAILALAVLTVSLNWGHTLAPKNSVAKQASTAREWLISGPGRVEPYSENIKLGTEISGKLKMVFVEEGATVRVGQVLAELENADYRAQVESAEAEVKQKEAELRKVIRGARQEERRAALSSTQEAQAVMKNAGSEVRRHQKLYEAGVISQEEAERYAKEYEVAKARYDERVQNHALIDEDAREEDRSMAEANLQDANAKLATARALFAKTFIRSPINGIVLRKHHRTGEIASNGSTNPDPIFTIGDIHTLRVRVDVDEADVSKLVLGQQAYVTADAYGDKKFWGRVLRIGREFGRKNVHTDEPTEHVDTKILETLIQLDDPAELPVGLRVDSFIIAASASGTATR